MIIAASEQDHYEILLKVMKRAKTANVKLNRDKIQFKVDTVKYMGHIITATGQRADESKIKAIVDIPTPEDKQSLQRLLGGKKILSAYQMKPHSWLLSDSCLRRIWHFNGAHTTVQHYRH